MANNYRQFSFRVEDLGGRAEAAKWALEAVVNGPARWREGLQALEHGRPFGFDDMFPEAEPPGPRFDAEARAVARQLAAKLFARLCIERPNCLKDADTEDLDELSDDFLVETWDGGVSIYAEEYGDVELAGHCASGLVEAFGLPPVGFAWADYCSRPQADGFNGGAAFCTSVGPTFTHTQTWLHERKAAWQEANPPSPAEPGTPGPAP